MDYLPTLCEKWPHSRGNVGKYSLHGASGQVVRITPVKKRHFHGHGWKGLATTPGTQLGTRRFPAWPVASARRSSLKRHAPALRASRWVASRPKGPRCPRHHCSTRPSESLSSSFSSCTVGESATFSKAIFLGYRTSDPIFLGCKS